MVVNEICRVGLISPCVPAPDHVGVPLIRFPPEVVVGMQACTLSPESIHIGFRIFIGVDDLHFVGIIPDRKNIIELILKHVDSGEIMLSRDNKKIEDHNEIRKEFETFLEPTLTKFVANALLV